MPRDRQVIQAGLTLPATPCICWLVCDNHFHLEPLRDMPLAYLIISHIPGPLDLSPLEGMRLTEVLLPGEVAKGLNVLRKMKSLTNIDRMPAEQFWKRYDAGEFPQYKP